MIEVCVCWVVGLIVLSKRGWGWGMVEGGKERKGKETGSIGFGGLWKCLMLIYSCASIEDDTACGEATGGARLSLTTKLWLNRLGGQGNRSSKWTS